MNRIQINFNNKETNAEELKKLCDILSPKEPKALKRRQNEMYILDTDIEALNVRFEELYRQVKNSPNLSEEQCLRECEILRKKYDFEIEELCKLRKIEYETQQARIKARERAETPWRRCWLWKLLFQPLTNRAQNIIEEEAELNAEEFFAPMEEELEARAEQLYNANGKNLSRRKFKRIFKKYLKYKFLLGIDNALQSTDEQEEDDEPQQSVDASPQCDDQEGNKQSEAPEPPIRKTRKQSGDKPPLNK